MAQLEVAKAELCPMLLTRTMSDVSVTIAWTTLARAHGPAFALIREEHE